MYFKPSYLEIRCPLVEFCSLQAEQRLGHNYDIYMYTTYNVLTELSGE